MAIKEIKWIDEESIEVDIESDKPFMVNLGGVSGSVAITLEEIAINKELFQGSVSAGRRTSKFSILDRMRKTHNKIMGKVFSEKQFVEYMKEKKIYMPFETDFTQKDLGISDEVIKALNKISEKTQLVIFNNIAVVDFLNYSAPKEKVKNLFQTNFKAVKVLYEIIQQFKNAVLINTGTFFEIPRSDGNFNNYYELSKYEAFKYLEGKSNVLHLRPSVVVSQSSEGFSPFSTINIDGVAAVLKFYMNQIIKNQKTIMDMDKNAPLNMVSVDKLAEKMLELTMKYLEKEGDREFETINCISDKSLTPQDTIDAFIRAYNYLNKDDQISNNFISIGRRKKAVNDPMLAPFLPYAQYQKRDYSDGFSDIGISKEELYKLTLWLLLKDFKLKGKTKFSINKLKEFGIVDVLDDGI